MFMNGRYILNADGSVREADSLLEWVVTYGRNRKVATDLIGDVMVSTIFLGLDHSFGMGPKPLLFETMVFGGNHDGYSTRYCTYDEAKAGHAETLAMVGRKLKLLGPVCRTCGAELKALFTSRYCPGGCEQGEDGR